MSRFIAMRKHKEHVARTPEAVAKYKERFLKQLALGRSPASLRATSGSRVQQHTVGRKRIRSSTLRGLVHLRLHSMLWKRSCTIAH